MFDKYVNFPWGVWIFSSSVPDNFKGRVPTRSFEGSIDVGLPTSSQVYHY